MLVIAGAWRTVKLKAWVAKGTPARRAVKVSAYVPPEPDGGLPASVAVPFPWSTNVTPVGNAPLTVMALPQPASIGP